MFRNVELLERHPVSAWSLGVCNYLLLACFIRRTAINCRLFAPRPTYFCVTFSRPQSVPNEGFTATGRLGKDAVAVAVTNNAGLRHI